MLPSGCTHRKEEKDAFRCSIGGGRRRMAGKSLTSGRAADEIKSIAFAMNTLDHGVRTYLCAHSDIL